MTDALAVQVGEMDGGQAVVSPRMTRRALIDRHFGRLVFEDLAGELETMPVDAQTTLPALDEVRALVDSFDAALRRMPGTNPQTGMSEAAELAAMIMGPYQLGSLGDDRVFLSMAERRLQGVPLCVGFAVVHELEETCDYLPKPKQLADAINRNLARWHLALATAKAWASERERRDRLIESPQARQRREAQARWEAIRLHERDKHPLAALKMRDVHGRGLVDDKLTLWGVKTGNLRDLGRVFGGAMVDGLLVIDARPTADWEGALGAPVNSADGIDDAEKVEKEGWS